MSTDKATAADTCTHGDQTRIGSPLLICGYPKSGTTLMLALLDGHSEVLVFPDETFLLRTFERYPNETNDERREWFLERGDVAKHIRAQNSDGPYGNIDFGALDWEEFGRHLTARLSGAPEGRKHFLRAVFEAYAGSTHQEDRRYWVEKTPLNEFFWRQMAEWFPETRTIYLVRDPRDACLSYRIKRQRDSFNREYLDVTRFMGDWLHSMRAWTECATAFPRSILVTYEDLVADPEATMRRICTLLEIDYEDALRTPTMIGKPWHGNSSHGVRHAQVTTISTGRWKDGLQHEEVAAIECFLGRPMTLLGYSRSLPEAGPLEFMRRSIKLLGSPRGRQLLGELIRLQCPFNLEFKRKPRDPQAKWGTLQNVKRRAKSKPIAPDVEASSRAAESSTGLTK